MFVVVDIQEHGDSCNGNTDGGESEQEPVTSQVREDCDEYREYESGGRRGNRV